MSEVNELRVEVKRQWRKDHNMIVNLECCCNCRYFANTDVLIGYCHLMSYEVNIPLLECSVQGWYSCSSFTQKYS